MGNLQLDVDAKYSGIVSYGTGQRRQYSFDCLEGCEPYLVSASIYLSGFASPHTATSGRNINILELTRKKTSDSDTSSTGALLYSSGTTQYIYDDM